MLALLADEVAFGAEESRCSDWNKDRQASDAGDVEILLRDGRTPDHETANRYVQYSQDYAQRPFLARKAW